MEYNTDRGGEGRQRGGGVVVAMIRKAIMKSGVRKGAVGVFSSILGPVGLAASLVCLGLVCALTASIY